MMHIGKGWPHCCMKLPWFMLDYLHSIACSVQLGCFILNWNLCLPFITCRPCFYSLEALLKW